MHRSTLFAATVLVAGAVGAIAYPVFAHCGKCAADGKTLAALLDKNKLTLDEAVEEAEDHSKGRAISVLSQLDEHDHVLLHVWCITGKDSEAPKIVRCNVDPATGKVSDMKEVDEFPTYDVKAHNHPHPHAPAAPRGGGASPGMISDRTVDAGCGACVYKMTGVTGCPLAVNIDGKTYLVEGAEWPNHDYCDHKCKAVVTGRIQGDKFIVSTLEVKQ
jgi:hypothetical protein